ncbi:MAG: hypothetical protein P1Q69_00180 [Candidatus Thorarchaeota archaeon]|nr:hypothetical protein [Candidatus Thorarchaeota archaeon]
MRGYRLILGLIVVALIVPTTLVTAQNTLTPNSSIENVSLFGNGNAFYSVDLETGDWTVLVISDAFWGMQFRVEVSLDSDMSTILNEAQGAGNQGVSVNFNLDSDRLVHIRVTEIGGQSGFYSVGVYDGLNLFIVSLGIWLIVIPVLVILFVGGIICAKKAPRTPVVGGIQIMAPDYAIPERYLRETESTQFRTVRVSEKCPTCGASLSQDNLDWTGSLEAECVYCKGVVRATFEKI